jgi:hypothetical protein
MLCFIVYVDGYLSWKNITVLDMFCVMYSDFKRGKLLTEWTDLHCLRF